MAVSPQGAKGACREGVFVSIRDLELDAGFPSPSWLDLDEGKAAKLETQTAGLAPCAPELRVLDPGRLYLDDDPSPICSTEWR
jgi:hypothetical protein